MSDQTVTRVSERLVLDSPWATIFNDDVQFGSGRVGQHLRIIEGQGVPGVAVLAECAGRFALVRTYRYTLQAWEWGIPRGHGHDHDPEVTARAELREELGAEPDALTSLGMINPNSGLFSGSVHLMYASYTREAATPEDTEEIAEVRWISLQELASEISDGSITEGFTVATLGAAAVRGIIRF